MSRFIDLTGQKFNRLTAIEYVTTEKGKRWRCRCECGTECFVSTSSLRSGHTKSCGCLWRDANDQKVAKYFTTHHMSNTRLYQEWCNIKARCYNKNHMFYKRYGGRGIEVCEEWRHDFNTFKNWAIANGYSDDLTIDRINNNGNYEPVNCRWATRTTQANNRSSNRLIAYGGEVYSMAEWAKLLDVHITTLYRRLKNSASVEDAFAV